MRVFASNFDTAFRLSSNGFQPLWKGGTSRRGSAGSHEVGPAREGNSVKIIDRTRGMYGDWQARGRGGFR